MSNNSMSATEIKRQSERLNTQSNLFKNQCKKITNNLLEMRKIIASEDSKLSDRLYDYASRFEGFYNAAKGQYDELRGRMNFYVERTLSNEETTATNVKKDTSTIVDK